MAHTGMTTDPSKGSTDTGRLAVRFMRWLLAINLGLVALQAVSAGSLLSGDGRAVTAHATGAVVLLLGAFIQGVTAIVLWRRRRVPPWVARFSVGLIVIVFLQMGLGQNKRYWLHVPVGVALFGWLARQETRLGTLWRTNGARP